MSEVKFGTVVPRGGKTTKYESEYLDHYVERLLALTFNSFIQYLEKHDPKAWGEHLFLSKKVDNSETFQDQEKRCEAHLAFWSALSLKYCRALKENEIKAIHAEARRSGHDKNGYVNTLSLMFGKTSSKDLLYFEFKLVMERFRANR
jgi:uncharacterized HAD superfamily protein